MAVELSSCHQVNVSTVLELLLGENESEECSLCRAASFRKIIGNYILVAIQYFIVEMIYLSN